LNERSDGICFSPELPHTAGDHHPGLSQIFLTRTRLTDLCKMPLPERCKLAIAQLLQIIPWTDLAAQRFMMDFEIIDSSRIEEFVQCGFRSNSLPAMNG
jgi:hypothetical protein